MTDDRGAVDLASVGGFDVSTYVFGGFRPPLRPQPEVNQEQAGRSIPVKWTLHRPDGTPVEDPTSFVAVQTQRVDCQTGELQGDLSRTATRSALSYSGNGAWHYGAVTSKAWAGTCRTLTLVLDDGVVAERSAALAFR